MEASNGFEPMIRQLQCLALPLGYEAINMLYHYNCLSHQKSISLTDDLLFLTSTSLTFETNAQVTLEVVQTYLHAYC
jgi:hypothetical protein